MRYKNTRDLSLGKRVFFQILLNFSIILHLINH